MKVPKPRLISAKEDGWPELKLHVARRDGGCISGNAAVFGKDLAPDLCRNKMGWTIDPYDWTAYEFEHVKIELGMSLKAEDNEAFGVSCCAWHHRLSNVWRVDTAAHREKVREYLAHRYPVHWASFLAIRSLEPRPDAV